MCDMYNNVYCMSHTLLSLPLSVGTRTSVMLTNLLKKKYINLVSKCEVMTSNSLLQNWSKYLEARSELLFRISGLHFGAHHGNVVSLWGHVVGKRHTGYIDIWRCKSSIIYAYIILLLCISQYEDNIHHCWLFLTTKLFIGKLLVARGVQMITQ